MTELSHLTRVLQDFCDVIRGLQRDNLSDEERSNMRAVVVEMNWLLDLTDEQA